jgi:hypothetical protein
MCDYSLDLVASRPAKVGDKLVTTKFQNSMTRGFAAIGEPSVAVCLLPGTEVAFEEEVQYERLFVLFPSMKFGSLGKKVAQFRQSTWASRTSITMRWNSPTGRSCCLLGCAKASTQRCCSYRLLRAL